MFKKITILFNLIFFVFLSGFCQGDFKGTVMGLVINEQGNKPFAFATITIIHLPDSVITTGGVTDDNGVFKIEGIENGRYFVRVSHIGFSTSETESFSINPGNLSVNIGTVKLGLSNLDLKSVEVTAQKSLFQSSIDKKIYNVDQDLVGQTGSATDALQNVPSVDVGLEGNISLRGSSNVTFFINGRPSALLRINSAAALQQIPASSIERIEIITNPSAKYKPDGNAGIINIVLKKNSKVGVNGTLMGNTGNNGRYNSSLTLNYANENINMFGNYGARIDNRPRQSNIFRTLKDSAGNPENYWERYSSGSFDALSHTGNFGLDYEIDDNNSLSFEAGGYYRNMDRSMDYATTLKNDELTVIEDFITDNNGGELEKEVEISGSWEHRIKENENHTFSIEMNAAGYTEQETNRYSEIFKKPAIQNFENDIKILLDGRQAEFYAEYVRPIGEESELEAGYVMSYNGVSINNDIRFLDTNENKWVVDRNKTNFYRMDQTIHAFYTTFSHSIEDFAFKAGLRAEQALINSNLVTLDSIIPNNYFKVYPTLHLSYELDEEQEIQMNYSWRVNRPDGDELNPFPVYSDNRNADAGNPYVKPEQTHSLEAGYRLMNEKITFMPTAYYRYTFNGFTEISRMINDTLQLTTFENLSSEKSAGLELILSATIHKILLLNFSSNTYYYEIDASNLGYDGSRQTIAMRSKLGANLNLSKTSMIQLNSFFRSGTVTPQGRYLPMFYMNAGARKDIFKKKASIVITVSDVFKTMRWNNKINNNQMEQVIKTNRKSQIFYIGFTWRFGKTGKKNDDKFNFDNGL